MKGTKAISLDVEDSEALDAEVGKVDGKDSFLQYLERYANVQAVAISLIPCTYHALVIKSAIRKKVNVVTTSYISPSMQELEKEIDEAGITVMNEIGIDPGIGNNVPGLSYSTYILTLSSRSSLRHPNRRRSAQSWRKDKKLSQLLWGLAAPECSDNPIGYKFSGRLAVCCSLSATPPNFLRMGKPKRSLERN